MKGNWGKILTVDLTAGTTAVEELPEKTYKDYLGGSGLAAKWFFDHEGWKADPLGPDNPFIVMLGPASGSGFLGTSRLEICARSPLTGIWGEACMGGHFAPQLRAAGYDGIIVTGASEKPVYLYVTDKVVEIRDASGYWGSDTYVTEDTLKEDVGEKRAQVICIGPAGENLVKYANVMTNRGSTAGRCGMGAVMGSKMLKAIVCRGRKKMQIHDPEGYKAVRAETLTKAKYNLLADGLGNFGTNVHMQYGMSMGDVPTKNWRLGYWRGAVKALGGITVAKTILSKTHSCYGCPVACKRITHVKTGPYATEEGPGAEYEAVVGMGSLQLVDDGEAVNRSNDLCNRMGMDVISCASTLAYATEACENGIIPDDVIGGARPTWGDAAMQVKLVEMIGRREGFGNELAEGSKAMSEKFGGKEYAIHVKGLECPMHDPRALWAMSLTYATSIRGACHCADSNLYSEMGVQNHSDLGIKRSWPHMVKGKAAQTVGSQVKGTIANSAVICAYAWLTFGETEELRAVINAITGLDYTQQEFVECADRIWYLKRAIGNLCGMTREDDQLPARIISPHVEGVTSNLIVALYPVMMSMGPMGKIRNDKVMNLLTETLNKVGYPNMDFLLRLLRFVPGFRVQGNRIPKREPGQTLPGAVPFEEMLTEYYFLRDIDEQGRPDKERLRALGLEDVAEVLFA